MVHARPLQELQARCPHLHCFSRVWRGFSTSCPDVACGAHEETPAVSRHRRRHSHPRLQRDGAMAALFDLLTSSFLERVSDGDLLSV